MEGDRGNKGKFTNGLGEALYIMSLEGWANQSDGDVQSPAGWFARISIAPEEVDEVVQAFEEQLKGVDLKQPELIGHFLLTEDEQGFVEVFEYDTEDELKRDYQALVASYDTWQDFNGEQDGNT